MTCTRTVLPVGMTSMAALPSGSVLTSRLPRSLPSRDGLKTTAALGMGLPLYFLVTCTSMCEVGGGALYLRPRYWLKPGVEAKSAIHATRMKEDQTVRRDDMALFYDVGGRSGNAYQNCVSRNLVPQCHEDKYRGSPPSW